MAKHQVTQKLKLKYPEKFKKFKIHKPNPPPPQKKKKVILFFTCPEFPKIKTPLNNSAHIG